MEKIRLSAKSIGKYIATALVFIGYPENIRVEVKVGEDGVIFCDASYQVFHDGKFIKVLMPISAENYELLFNYGLELEGINPFYINKRIKDGQVNYTIGYDSNDDKSFIKTRG